MRGKLVAGAISIMIGTAAHAEPVTDGQLTAATLRLITHIATDAFDAAPSADFSGRTFVIEIPVAEFAYDTFKCQPYWTYARDAGVLKVSVQQGLASTYMMRRGPGAALTGAADQAYQFRPFVCSNAPVTRSKGVNGFGAAVDIQHHQTTVIGLSKPYRRETLTWSRVVTPDEGRALAGALRVRMSGTVGTWGAGGSIGCVRDHTDATFSSPIEDDTTMCVVRVADLRTDLIDSRTGEVLATELPTDADPPKGKKRR
ncbi:hypothetical protein GO308_17885 [Sphingomonas sp. SFZ2018-12]|uniref:hypothetical protein n=1 Tax=Sphingomonas sp. SFZ2018-12 TaxID=2683197 RepID=UPI001F1177B3|nr:hypothetical protein [Sphingomonas sp. SFZ2018-12]MCH4894977.1 hypothetical protein [Sphingomonas sp. SFZ2018-12]